MIRSRIATACVLVAACRYDANLGVARTVDGIGIAVDAPAPAWAIATTFNGMYPHDVHGVSAVTAWVVGAEGAMWRWDGQTLLPAASAGTDVAFDAVWLASESLGYAVGARDGAPAMVQWDGAQWSETTSSADNALTGVHGVVGANVRTWAIGHAFNFVHRPTATTAWQRLSSQDLVYWPEDLWVGGDGGDIWVVGNQGIARFRESDGAFVEQFAGGTWWGVDGRAANDVWVVGAQGAIRHWNGTAWNDTPSGVTVTLRDVWAAAPDAAWAVGDQGTVLRWDGSAWHIDADFSPWNLTGIWGASDSNIFAVGSTATAGVVVRYGHTEIGL